MEELELKEDYSGLSREEALDLAEGWMKESEVFITKKHQPAEAAKCLEKAIPIFKKFEKWDSYIDCRNNMVAILDFSFNSEILQNPVTYWEETFKLIQKKIPNDYHRIYKSLVIITKFYAKKRKLDKALMYGKRNLELVEKHYEPNSQEVIWVYSILANIYSYLRDFPQSIAINLKVISICIETSNNQWLLHAYSNLSLEYSHYGEQELALSINKKALKLATQLGETNSIHIICGNRGLIYNKIGDYHQSAIYCQKALEESTKLLGVGHPHTADQQDSLGHALIELQQYKKALYYFQIALKTLQEKLEPNHYRIAAVHSSLNILYQRNENYLLALKHAQKSLNIQLSSLGKEHPLTLKSLKKVAIALSFLQKEERAMEIFEEARNGIEKTWGKTHPEAANIYQVIADHYLQYKQTQRAISYILKAEEIILQKDEGKIINTQNFLRSQYLLPIQSLKGYSFYQHYLQKTQEVGDLRKAIEAFKESIDILDKMRQSYHNEGSKLLWNAKKSKLYEEGIEAALEMTTLGTNVQSTAFRFSEKAKASLLLSSLQTELARTAGHLPVGLSEKEKEMKLKLTYLDKRSQKLQSKKEKEELNEYEIQSLKDCQDEFFHLHQNYTDFLQQLETDYPDYYQLKYDTKTVTPTELQSTLTDNQILLSYFIGEKSLYIFTVTSHEFEVEELEKPDDFEEMIQGFLKSIHAHDKADYLQLAYELYELLIAPVELHWFDDWGDLLEEEETAQKQLIIIPHAELSYLPFEALISEPADEEEAYPKLKYLVKNYEISYHYSATLWQYAQQKKGERAETEHSFVGFAPVYESTLVTNKREGESGKYEVGSDALVENLNEAAKVVGQWATRSEALRSDGTWTPLPHSKEEAKNIAALFEGKGLSSEIYLQEAATKERFHEAVSKARYLLVAAHGVVNDEKTALSGLVFYPSTGEYRISNNEHRISNAKHRTPNIESPITNHQNDCILSMEETYPLNIHADLVVLSSCESGIGKLHKGEGMMAVNRGFLVAGAKNVISTLFKVYDKPSSLLTQYLFEAILEEEDYRTALRKAKLRLLESEGVSPKSWCGFVLIGG